jgi:hypothetical protein
MSRKLRVESFHAPGEHLDEESMCDIPGCPKMNKGSDLFAINFTCGFTEKNIFATVPSSKKAGSNLIFLMNLLTA